MDNEYTVAPGTNEPPRDVVTELADTLRRVNAEGLVSRKDVEPYIDQFPPHVGLDDFDEEPSTRNLEMATESMAAFLKLGLAVAVIGAIGFVAYHLITSRNKCKKVSTEDGWRSFLFKEVNKARGMIINSPVWLNQGMVGADGLNIQNAIEKMLNDDPSVALQLEGEGKRLFSRQFYGDIPYFGQKSGISAFGDVLAQTRAIETIRKELKDAGDRIQHGQASEVIAAIVAVRDIAPVNRLVDAITGAFGSQLPRVTRKPGQTDGNFLLEVTELLEGYYGAIEDSSVSNIEAIRRNLLTLGSGFAAYPAGNNDVDLTQTEEACKKAGAECDKLKAEARSYKLSTEVETVAGEAIDELSTITKAGSRLIDLAGLEVTSAFRHAKWVANVHIEILKLAENILRHNSEGQKAGGLEQQRRELERAVKKAL